MRGCRKCVPLKVDRKLYSATLLVRLAISTDAVTCVVLLRVEQVVGADAQVEDVARLHAVGIVIVVLLRRPAAA